MQSETNKTYNFSNEGDFDYMNILCMHVTKGGPLFCIHAYIKYSCNLRYPHG